MPTFNDESSPYTQLRDKAVAQLKKGSTSRAGHWSLGVDALRLLHQLSSDPERAEDAVKLLHELQVHQVELDLQHEAILSQEHERSEDYRLFRDLYDSAPFAYFVVDVDGTIIQSNQAAAELFLVLPEQLEGQRIDGYLSAESRPQLLNVLQQVANNGMTHTGVVDTRESGRVPRPLRFQAFRAPEQAFVFLICFEGAHAQ